MAKAPRKRRELKRAAEPLSEVIVSRPFVRRRDLRQAELFATSFVEPCKPTLRMKVPVGPQWQYKIKHDGYRVQCHVSAGAVRIYTKSGLDWSTRMPGVKAAIAALPVDNTVIDGDAVMFGADGVTDFFALHRAMAGKSAPEVVLYSFDLLHLDGDDLRDLALDERRLLLEDVLIRAGEPTALPFSDHVLKGGAELLATACAGGLEGIIAKRRDAPHRSGRSETWLKIKCTRTAHFAVIGFDPDETRGMRALRIAELVGSELKPAGAVGSGLTLAASTELRRLLDRRRPVVVEVEFRGRTPSGGLRHPVCLNFQRDDDPPVSSVVVF